MQRSIHRGLATAAYILLLVRQSFFLPPLLLFAAGTAESAHLHMESGALNRNVIDLPPICKGEMFPNLPGLFLHHCMTRSTGGDWIQRRELKPGAVLLTCYRPPTHPQHQKTLVKYERQYIYNYACRVACIQKCLKQVNAVFPTRFFCVLLEHYRYWTSRSAVLTHPEHMLLSCPLYSDVGPGQTATSVFHLDQNRSSGIIYLHCVCVCVSSVYNSVLCVCVCLSNLQPPYRFATGRNQCQRLEQRETPL